jgi:hypothetical protein
MVLSDKDIKKISSVLGVVPHHSQGLYRFEITSAHPGRGLSFEIHADVRVGKRKGPLLTVYTSNAHLQLHFCTGYVASDFLGEVTFVGEMNGMLSGLTIEREGGCSLYANVDRSVLSGDFTRLGPEVMLSGVALSLTESILPEVSSPARTSRATPKKKVRKRA